ncbi:DUF6480 family protein [Nocardia goodfellowii]|uniref:Uncharacterized protein n=1 Tax=Nocardia goodfellowii TaxID=882446 RepID=A0ABS4QL89_9NOCA|nr:DUF6480 family protein [Nocardia goodfellowii]MBP2191858.1 hypothetical protein [Nocardia goodfellowii]
MTAMDPDPAKTPDLEPGGGVAPGSTPPETPQTSGLSAPEPATRHRFPVTGIGAIVVIVVIIALFTAAAVGIVISII